MKRPHVQVELNEPQILILALVLVILIATSVLYCVGLGSLMLRQVWRNTPLPTETTLPSEASPPAHEDLELAPNLSPLQSPPPTAIAP